MAENKKEGFTFSDKIKSSKPAFNPFSKRVASKIGNNGKPKQTLFERTRRDAPFFIAALAALLLLPFLYKYSGTVEEETFVRPGSVTDDYIPERFDYDPTIGADSVEQITGRDPLSLIVGANRRTETETVTTRQMPERDSIDDYSHARRNNTSRVTETNTYRKQAPAATRAAFKRAPAEPTKINALRGASLAARGGGGIGSRFGGANLKAAAKENSAGGPRQGVKPVSLQPLRAAGSPSRSYFGQGGAAQARASRDAMSKANATEAVRDAMFAPIENKRMGGLGDGVFAAGGGAGKFDRTMDFKGITPWWWDMMKEREQKKWEWKYFLWRKPLAEAISRIIADFAGGLSGFLSCLATGTDDWSMGSMGGADATQEVPGGCKFWDKTLVTFDDYCGKHADDDACVSADAFKKACENEDIGGKGNSWSDGHSAHGRLTAWGRRKHCLNESYAGKFGNIDLVKEKYNCNRLITDKYFEVDPAGKYAKWPYVYHAVIVENSKLPLADGGEKQLCDLRSIRANRSNQGDNNEGTVTKNGKIDGVKITRTNLPENEGCVIYVAKGKVFQHAAYQASVDDLLTKSGFAANAFSQLHPIMVEGYVMEKPMATCLVGGNCWNGLPTAKHLTGGMTYTDFLAMHVNNRTGVFGIEKERNTTKIGGGMSKISCDWPAFTISANPINQVYVIGADLSYDPTVCGDDGSLCEVTVAEISDVQSGRTLDTGITRITRGACKNRVCHYTLNQDYIAEFLGNNVPNDASNEQPFEFRVTWQAQKGDMVSTDAAVGSTGSKPHDTISRPNPQPECTEDLRIKVTGTQSCYMVRKCVNNKWGDIVQEGDDCPDDNGGNGGNGDGNDGKGDGNDGKGDGNDGKGDGNGGGDDGTTNICVLAESMSQIATTVDGHAHFPTGKNSQKVSATGQMLFSTFKEDADAEALSRAMVEQRTGNGTAAEDFVAKVTSEVAAKDDNSCDMFMFNEKALSVREFVDALNMAQQELDIKDVPSSAICQMARGVAIASHDVLDGNTLNEFGTFLIYIGLDSVYFPNNSKKLENGKKGVDERFNRDPYWYGNYVGTAGVYQSVKNQIEAAKVKGKYPLASMLSDMTPIQVEGLTQNNTNNIVDVMRNKYNDQYSFLYNGTGECSKLTGTMPIEDAKNYISQVIELGLAYKPQAVASTGNHKDNGGTAGSYRNRTGATPGTR